MRSDLPMIMKEAGEGRRSEPPEGWNPWQALLMRFLGRMGLVGWPSGSRGDAEPVRLVGLKGIKGLMGLLGLATLGAGGPIR